LIFKNFSKDISILVRAFNLDMNKKIMNPQNDRIYNLTILRISFRFIFLNEKLKLVETLASSSQPRLRHKKRMLTKRVFWELNTFTQMNAWKKMVMSFSFFWKIFKIYVGSLSNLSKFKLIYIFKLYKYITHFQH